MALLNSARMTTATTGTGTVTLGSAVAKYFTFAEAGAVNATVYSYRIEEGNDFEIGIGTYTSSGTTFSRDTVTASKIGGTAGTSKMNLAGAAEIIIVARAQDFDVPNPTTIELGGPGVSDTTLGRFGAGVLGVEGVALYPNIPVDSKSAAYPIVLADAGRMLLHDGGDNNARTFTIPANGTIPFPVGTCISFFNGVNVLTIAITTDTLVWAGPGTTGSRSLAANGMATAVKLLSTTWVISGVGLS